jgi:leucyl/phenylalanyl-tRNA---protein transferase
MAINLLDENLVFPHPSLANKEGLLAIGGDLSIPRLLLAYESGIFPWYDDETPILWWSPDPRMVLLPGNFRCSKSLRLLMNKGIFEVRFDTCFKEVMRRCARVPRAGQEGTWIIPEMIDAYSALHKEGFAHSVEAFKDGKLAGGLYGVSLGKAFFGESMFFHERDASKVALAALVDRLTRWDFHFIDAQQETGHLKSLGAKPVRRDIFLEMLNNALRHETIRGKW